VAGVVVPKLKENGVVDEAAGTPNVNFGIVDEDGKEDGAVAVGAFCSLFPNTKGGESFVSPETDSKENPVEPPNNDEDLDGVKPLITGF
jgi:hypothetical protein